MEFFNKIRGKIQGLEEKEFKKYILIFLGSLVVLVSLFIFRYYRKVGSLERKIEDINDERSTEVRTILNRAKDVKKRREEVNKLLKEEEGFKIVGYFDALQKNMRLSAAEVNSSQKELEGDYRESELDARFVGISMQQLCELLQEIDKKKRIYTKKLEIKKSKKPKAIDVILTIATLQPKTEEETT